MFEMYARLCECVVYNVAKVQIMRCVASSLKALWCESIQWNMKENFSMEWNMEWKIFSKENFSMEWKIFSMEWKKIASMNYGK